MRQQEKAGKTAKQKKERREYKELWEERLSPSNWLSYRIAELEYELQTDGVSVRNMHSLEMRCFSHLHVRAGECLKIMRNAEINSNNL